MSELRVPALRITQGSERRIYSFGIDGKLLDRIAAVSRIGRDHSTAIIGYQRPEVIAHINAIRGYIESEAPMLPNGIVVAFDGRVQFESADNDSSNGPSSSGMLVIPLDEEER